MKAAELFVRCLENEGVEYIFGIPGEENLDVMDALLDSPIKFITVRHEQGAAFMADVYGRLTGRPGVCLATLGPGATNLITGVADANMDHAPLVAIAGQAGTDRLHKESHQVLNLEQIFHHVTKYSTRIMMPGVIPEVVRKAFKVAVTEKPGATFIEFPENIAKLEVDDRPMSAKNTVLPEPPADRLAKAAQLISNARNPLVLAGNGVIRTRAWEALQAFAQRLNIPVANTFMAKGVLPLKHPMAMGSAGLQSSDYANCGFSQADVIICVGYDLAEYHPRNWHPTRDRVLIHIDTTPAEVDAHYAPEVGVVGDIRISLERLAELSQPHAGNPLRPLRDALVVEMNRHRDDASFPVKPQKLIWDLRHALGPSDIVICDVGAHKMWMARMYRCDEPNTCIISNGFASMGIAVPGALAAALAYPQRKVVAVTGDAGFLMNSQELETAQRLGLSFVVLIWNDQGYGLIKWKQLQAYGRASHADFANPDFVTYARSFGAHGYRVEKTADLLPTIQRALADNGISIIDCPVDYAENARLRATLGEVICPT
ncbi:MAG: acetolactate synthase large subunit [Pseudomonadota bacterium]